MTSTAATAATADRAGTRARTGGPEDGSNVLEHILGWTLVVVLAMLVTQLGLI
ncbi:SCO1431 family membrane protein [Streptomyces sp. NPDC002870]|uniref:SCO1431 family membrane protein n=1 Tax=Streptomyces sp. NPDC002870 TaxID=3364666 RepID=UPI0036B1F9C6